MTTDERTTRNRIRAKLAAHAALTLCYHAHNDERGLDLAHDMEREAHALWVGLGHDDCPTWQLVALTAE